MVEGDAWEDDLRVTVCEIGDDVDSLTKDWAGLVDHARVESSELVLLPELPFFPWPRTRSEFGREAWDRSMLAHYEWMSRLVELAPALVAGSRPVLRDGRRINEGFVWSHDGGYNGVHGKYYLPEEEGYWEATWYERGDGAFDSVRAGGAVLGFLICSELWAMSHAAKYGKKGAHILVNPRTTGRDSVEKWLLGGRACAIVSGCYSLSSNRVSEGSGTGGFGGQGWIVGPDGDVLGLTSRARRFVTCEIDLKAAEVAKTTYPRSCID